MPLNFSCASAASLRAAASFASYSAFTESRFGADGWAGCETVSATGCSALVTDSG